MEEKMYFWDKHKTIISYYELLSGAVCDRYELTQMEYDILMFLHNNPQNNTAAEIVKIRKSTKSHVSTSLKKLEKGGYIQKTQQEQDSRVRFVELTEKGRGVVEESKEIFHQMDAKLLEGFDKEQLEVLQSLLGQMYRNAKNIE